MMTKYNGSNSIVMKSNAAYDASHNVTGDHTSVAAKRHLIPRNEFNNVHGCVRYADIRTDGRTDHTAITSAAIAGNTGVA